MVSMQAPQKKPTGRKVAAVEARCRRWRIRRRNRASSPRPWWSEAEPVREVHSMRGDGRQTRRRAMLHSMVMRSALGCPTGAAADSLPPTASTSRPKPRDSGRPPRRISTSSTISANSMRGAEAHLQPRPRSVKPSFSRVGHSRGRCRWPRRRRRTDMASVMTNGCQTAARVMRTPLTAAAQPADQTTVAGDRGDAWARPLVLHQLRPLHHRTQRACRAHRQVHAADDRHHELGRGDKGVDRRRARQVKQIVPDSRKESVKTEKTKNSRAMATTALEYGSRKKRFAGESLCVSRSLVLFDSLDSLLMAHLTVDFCLTRFQNPRSQIFK